MLSIPSKGMALPKTLLNTPAFTAKSVKRVQTTPIWVTSAFSLFGNFVSSK